MKNVLILLVFILSSCNSKHENLIRQNETLNIIQTILEQNGSEMVKDFSNNGELPICLNLKKVIVNNECFVESVSNNEIVTVKFPEKTFTSNGKVCMEKIYKSKPIEDKFFLVKDSLDILNQNETFKNFKIPKTITGKFKTVEQTKNLKITEKYIQFSIPIFSADNTKVYVEFDSYSNSEDSYGNSLYLEKIEGKWKIKYVEVNWAI